MNTVRAIAVSLALAASAGTVTAAARVPAPRPVGAPRAVSAGDVLGGIAATSDAHGGVALGWTTPAGVWVAGGAGRPERVAPVSERAPAALAGLAGAPRGPLVALVSADRQGSSHYVLEAAARAARWTTARVVPGGDGVGDAAVAADAGRAYAMWTTRGGSRLVGAVLGAGRWSPARVLSTQPRAPFSRPVIAAGDGRAVAAWAERVGARLLLRTAEWKAGRWRGPQTVVSVAASPRRALAAEGLAVDDDGGATIFWAVQVGLDERARADVYTASRPPDGTWSPPLRLTPKPGTGLVAAVAGAADGSAIAVWGARDRAYTLAYAYRPAGGSWTRVQRVPGSPIANTPDLAVALARGRALLVWDDQSARGSTTRTRSLDPATGSWSPPHALARLHAPANAHTVAALPVPRGVAVVWRESSDDRHVLLHVQTVAP